MEAEVGKVMILEISAAIPGGHFGPESLITFDHGVEIDIS
jgi:hypothetical protein